MSGYQNSGVLSAPDTEDRVEGFRGLGAVGDEVEVVASGGSMDEIDMLIGVGDVERPEIGPQPPIAQDIVERDAPDDTAFSVRRVP